MSESIQVVSIDQDQHSQASSVLEATESGSRLNILTALRERIAMAIDDLETPARDLAALSKRLVDLEKEIEQLNAEIVEEATGGSVSEDAKFTAKDI